MKRIQINPGDKYNRLTVIKELAPIPRKGRGTYRIFECKCDCGNIVNVRLDHLRDGHTSSCGCYNKEKVQETHTKHGLYKHPLYIAWINIKARCYNKSNPEYCYYGNKGICLCDEWLNNFESFYDWSINNGWNKNLSIDRINNNGNYCPENCRWTTKDVQANNTSRTHKYEYQNKIYTIKELEKEFNVPYKLLYSRLVNLNWPIEKAINSPKYSRIR